MWVSLVAAYEPTTRAENLEVKAGAATFWV
jgi:hypothetical protein